MPIVVKEEAFNVHNKKILRRFGSNSCGFSMRRMKWLCWYDLSVRTGPPRRPWSNGWIIRDWPSLHRPPLSMFKRAKNSTNGGVNLAAVYPPLCQWYMLCTAVGPDIIHNYSCFLMSLSFSGPSLLCPCKIRYKFCVIKTELYYLAV
jgi:hypothetical protein